MGCQQTKCGNPQCTTILRACQLIGGLCPSCHAKKVQEQIQQAQSNANNTKTNQ